MCQSSLWLPYEINHWLIDIGQTDRPTRSHDLRGGVEIPPEIACGTSAELHAVAALARIVDRPLRSASINRTVVRASERCSAHDGWAAKLRVSRGRELPPLPAETRPPQNLSAPSPRISSAVCCAVLSPRLPCPLPIDYFRAPVAF